MSAFQQPPIDIEAAIAAAAWRGAVRAPEACLWRLYEGMTDILRADPRAMAAARRALQLAGVFPMNHRRGRLIGRRPTPDDAANLLIAYMARDLFARAARVNDAVALQAMRFELIGMQSIDCGADGALTTRMHRADELGPELLSVAEGKLGLGQRAGGLLFRNTLAQTIADGWTGRVKAPNETEITAASIGIASRVPYVTLTLQEATGTVRIWWAETDGYAALQSEMAEPGSAPRFLTDRALALSQESAISAWALAAIGRLLGAPTADDIAAWSLTAAPPCDPVPAE